MAYSREIKFRAAWWQQLKLLGYDVIPLYAKDAPYKGWPKMPNDAAAIGDWSGAGAAVRMRGSELLVIDLDVHVAAARDLMLAWMGEHHTEFMDKWLRRHSGAISIALIGRTVTAKGTQKTARYLGEGTAPKGDFVEVFTGNSKRYVGVAGRHSEGREYDYHGRHITETPVEALPWLADCEIAPVLAAFEQIMVSCGWEKVVPAIGKDAIGTKVYDLEPEMIFKLSDGTEVTLAELGEMAKRGMTLGDDHDTPGDNRLRGYASLWDPSTGSGDHSSTRVLVTYGREGLCLYDTKYEVRHRWKSAAPQPDLIGDKLRELMKLMMANAEVQS